ncbi:3-isopropylmalate dehydrogenase [Anaerobacillus alkalidiazotrophicus]|uniref:3-isopropylmalate dehydrogenase n=1 Tax=Anaerobacillus alkalidiazotrophicus TaxID=472963 RepID=A0A1S2M7K9_9BACI|nr:3-isopropylmalate dehydrogenase [Anaerobacillus alkalidiazotrophicus]OIJ18338.1 3-isopropylmalate dehydrogenase [Anaerobacillus alkalidiazotrophicus]OIJ19817.1 3-isopropylmalate dehydrogenase [Anaerobacillus alkalidiazotrophicus]
MNKTITVLPGDGIGPEVIKAAQKVLDTVAEKFSHQFTYQNAKIGGVAIDEDGTPLPQETIDLCKKSDGVLLGAVGGPKWDTLPGHMRPERGLLGIRKALELYANLRPVTAHKSLLDASTLKREVIEGVDLMIVRELTGGLYFGQPQERRQENDGESVVDTLYYKNYEIERIIRQAFELARLRRKKVTSVDKANVLESSRVWREIAIAVHADYPDVELEHMLVDNAAMQLIRDPKQFDVVVTENMFGDILSDEASMLTGSLGMLPSASINGNGPGLYEPIHGSAPDIAGKNLANPLATILSVAMLLRYSFLMQEEADAVETAVTKVLEAGYRTGDIAEKGQPVLSTEEMTEKVIEHIQLAVTN